MLPCSKATAIFANRLDASGPEVTYSQKRQRMPVLFSHKNRSGTQGTQFKPCTPRSNHTARSHHRGPSATHHQHLHPAASEGTPPCHPPSQRSQWGDLQEEPPRPSSYHLTGHRPQPRAAAAAVPTLGPSTVLTQTLQTIVSLYQATLPPPRQVGRRVHVKKLLHLPVSPHKPLHGPHNSPAAQYLP